MLNLFGINKLFQRSSFFLEALLKHPVAVCGPSHYNEPSSIFQHSSNSHKCEQTQRLRRGPAIDCSVSSHLPSPMCLLPARRSSWPRSELRSTRRFRTCGLSACWVTAMGCGSSTCPPSFAQRARRCARCTRPTTSSNTWRTAKWCCRTRWVLGSESCTCERPYKVTKKYGQPPGGCKEYSSNFFIEFLNIFK